MAQIEQKSLEVPRRVAVVQSAATNRSLLRSTDLQLSTSRSTVSFTWRAFLLSRLAQTSARPLPSTIDAVTLLKMPLIDSVLLPALKGQAGRAVQVYTASYTYLASYVLTFFPLIAGIDAPHGKFAPRYSKLNVNGNVGWLLMEIVSPVTFYLTLTRHTSFASLTFPVRLLSLAWFTHYANRAVISVLRQKGQRSPMMFYIPLLSASFNFANAHSIAAWLAGFTISSPPSGALTSSTLYSPIFLGGMTLWALGLAGNVYHDEILRNLRGPGKPQYSLPRGALYEAPFGGISYPNYFCEIIEWTGFALAATFAAPFVPPPLIGQGSAVSAWKMRLACPPWLFVFGELAFLTPRALSGHRWYAKKFEDMPKERRALMPGVM